MSKPFGHHRTPTLDATRPRLWPADFVLSDDFASATRLTLDRVEEAATRIIKDHSLREQLAACATQIHTHPKLRGASQRALTGLLSVARGGPIDVNHCPPPTEALSPDILPQPIADLYPLVVLLAATPITRALHAAAGIDAAITDDTLDDLQRWANAFHRRHHRWGAAELPWLNQCVTGGLFRLGRLQFEPIFNRWPIPDQPPGAPLLNVHIPVMGPLTPDACDASFADAQRFFAIHFPHVPFVGYACDSWLLDPQLADYLHPRSNILRFQQRFNLLPDVGGVNEHLRELVFDLDRIKDPAARDALRLIPQTTLQHAVLEHLAAGKPWRYGIGWRPLTD